LHIQRKLSTLPAWIRKAYEQDIVLWQPAVYHYRCRPDQTRQTVRRGHQCPHRLDKKTYKSRGFGFVEVPDDAAKAVIAALNGTRFHGRDLKVNESAPHPTRKDQSWKDKDRMDYEDIFDE